MAWVGPAIGAAGSVLGGALGGKGNKSGGTPKFLRNYIKNDVFPFAREAAAQGFDPYGGERVAPFSGDTMAAFDLFRERVGQDPYAGLMGQVNGLMGYSPQQVNAQQINSQFNAPQFAGQDLSPYMNPFISNVVDTSLNDIERSRQMAGESMDSQAAAAGAFGGSRHGVANSLTNEGYAREAANTAANLRMQGFNTAAGLLENDLGRQWAATELGQRSDWANQQADLQAQLANQGAGLQSQGMDMNLAGLLGNLTGAQQGLMNQNLASLLGAGMTQDQRQQALLDVPYQDYRMAQDWPLRQLGILTSALGGTGGMSSGQTMGGGLAGALGGAQLGGQMAGGLYDLWGSIFNKPQIPSNLQLDFTPTWQPGYQYSP